MQSLIHHLHKFVRPITEKNSPPTSIETRTRAVLVTLAHFATLLCLWSLTYEYRGLIYDAQIYAVQALAKLRPSLATDLFLQNVSQDKFTVFPRLYAWTIELIDLRPAALLLTIVFTLWFVWASWALVKTLANNDLAWLAAFIVVTLAGDYGAFGVFSVTEPFLTARLPAESLLISALTCYLRGYLRIAFVVALAAFFLHPLMALPVILLLICLRLPPRVTVFAASVGVLGTLIAAIAVTEISPARRILTVMDTHWVDVVRERSQFLFLQLWRVKDWSLNVRPFVSLALSAIIFRSGNAHALAFGAIVVGAMGVAIGAIASTLGPVALLMQGQTWRWVWITTIIGVLLLLPTAYEAWKDDRRGRMCAILLVGGWLLPVEAGVACVSLALIVWTLGSNIHRLSPKYARLAEQAVVFTIVCWSLKDSVGIYATMPAVRPGESYLAALLRAVFSLKIWCVLFAAVLWCQVRVSRGIAFPAITLVAIGTLASFMLYQSSRHVRPYGAASDIKEFADWREHIPEGSTVYVTNGYDSGSFVWFTLQRNNYLSPGQSAGVVFSRATAIEVKRRSDLLLPLADPNWRVLTSLRSPIEASIRSVPSASFLLGARSVPPGYRRLTAQSLTAVCNDRVLGFVVSPDDVGFDPVPHRHPGLWNNWLLYDCNKVRARVPTT
jgi:hypothetical protein